MGGKEGLLDRLGRRGKLTITVEDGLFDVRLVAPGPYVGGWSTTDKADLFEHCRLGAKSWHGEGLDLAGLLLMCEMESRPDTHGVDDLVWLIEHRRHTRTAGPPLPSYMRWHGWRPGQERWLRTSSHAHEYLAGYERDLRTEQEFNAERADAERRRKNDELRQRRNRALSHSVVVGASPGPDDDPLGPE